MAARKKPAEPQLKLTILRPTEAGLRHQFVEWLRWMKVRVLEIGQFRWKIRCAHCGYADDEVKCKRCGKGFEPKIGYGNDLGAPDAFLSGPTWRLDAGGALLSFWVGAEWKRDAKAPVRPEQKELIEAGYVEKIWTAAQLEDVVRIGDAFFAFAQQHIAQFNMPAAPAAAKG